MANRFDWKFWAVLVATLAGILAPVWLWRADLEARSLHVRKLSQTSLHPLDSSKALDLRVSVGGSELQDPYLSVFELANDRARPIPATDFESPFEITSNNKAQIIRASVTKVMPADLAPSVSLEGGVLKLKPMLLNPGDSITIAVLTTNEEPSFTPRARIAGIRSVSIVEPNPNNPSQVLIVFMGLAAAICLVAANLVVSGRPTKGVVLRPRASFLIFVVSGFTAGLLLSNGLEKLGFGGFWVHTGVFLGCMLLTSFIASWLNRPEPTQVTGRTDAV